jgi:hypothetical protein
LSAREYQDGAYKIEYISLLEDYEKEQDAKDNQIRKNDKIRILKIQEEEENRRKEEEEQGKRKLITKRKGAG